jgi:D-alanyl-D-alanine carboxypeptidase/D-alanyl-D-alanine-endopeptidase (penicillin-binding protein 4)
MIDLQLKPPVRWTIAPLLVGLPGLISTAAIAQGPPPGLCPAQLATAVAPILKRSQVAGVRWGILVERQTPIKADRTTLFSRNPTTLLIPASNNKLFTTTAALLGLGQHYTIRTTITGSGTPPNLNTLRIIGHGDPTLTTAQLTRLAQDLNQRGIRQVDQLIGDDTYFRGSATNPYWEREDTLTGYAATVNSLMVNQNGIGFSLVPQQIGQPLRIQWDDPADAAEWKVVNRSRTVTGNQGEYVDASRDPNQRLIRIDAQLRAGSEPEPTSVSVPNPGSYLLQKFQAALAIAGITAAKTALVKITPAAPGESELANVESPLLRDMLVETNQQSNNIYAETLLKTLGNVQAPGNSNSTEAGIATVKNVLTRIGVDPTLYNMVDGSGLASRNRASAQALVQVLQGIALSPEEAQVLRDSLSVAGVSGTLKKRFKDTPVKGQLRAKTGYIAGAVALSGYLNPPNYPPVALSILANYSSAPLAAVRKSVDDIVLTLARLDSSACSNNTKSLEKSGRAK